MSLELRTIAEGLRFPEGPIAMADGSIIIVEIERRSLSRVAPDGAVTPIAFPGGGPNGAAIGPDGKCYVCNNGGFNWHETTETGLRPHGQASDYSGGRIERIDLTTGEVEVLYTASDKAPLKGPNDLVFDAHGGFWFTDHGKVRDREVDRGSVCYAKADGSFIKEVIFPLWSPNGIGLSPDETVLYVAETFTGRVWAFDIAAPGELMKQPWPQSPNGGKLLIGIDGYRGFDSLAVDSAGNVCVATIYDGGIAVIPPEGGTYEFLPLPDALPTNLCFGGPELRTAYITYSNRGKLVAAEWPRPGLPLNYLNK
ncbi:SMP-30/gluconolactonase/LRE family protein [Rhodoligotrophos ferricapiens]|uniref:SMP-30/gluconolactonase/LRE family protein n=1 Tax=Rhodoligotrophos ferricapiens TaxID=3069264 RepID=UPI00315D3A29